MWSSSVSQAQVSIYIRTVFLVKEETRVSTAQVCISVP